MGEPTWEPTEQPTAEHFSPIELELLEDFAALETFEELLDGPAGQGCAEGWRKVVSPFEGKTELFQTKVTKKGPKTGSGWIIPPPRFRSFFCEFPGSRKIQDEMPGAGNGVKPAHMRFVKITEICYRQTGKQTLAV